jgi:Protein of unknown function (DUF1569)
MKTFLTEYDNLVARLEQLKSTSQPEWGIMNVNEMLVHVSQPLLVALGHKKGTDESNFFTRTVLKYVALNLIKKIPKNRETPKDFDVKQNSFALKGFEIDRKNLLALMAEFKNDTSEYKNRIHPQFGVFNRQEWNIQSYMHLDHHFRQFGV